MEVKKVKKSRKKQKGQEKVKVKVSKNDDSKEPNETPKQSKSAKKREKKLKNPNHVHESKGQSKALRYLKLWYSSHQGLDTDEPWKFEKCRQIWLLQNCYNSAKISKDDFKVLLKYMTTIKGRMKMAAIDEAKEKLELSEKWQSSLSEGKEESKVAAEIGKPQPDETTVKRARKIVKKCNVDGEEIPE